MNAKRSSYLLITLSLVAVVMLAFAAGCTGNGTKTPVATAVPTASPTGYCNHPGTGINHSCTGNDNSPGLNRPETDH